MMRWLFFGKSGTLRSGWRALLFLLGVFCPYLLIGHFVHQVKRGAKIDLTRQFFYPKTMSVGQAAFEAIGQAYFTGPLPDHFQHFGLNIHHHHFARRPHHSGHGQGKKTHAAAGFQYGHTG